MKLSIFISVIISALIFCSNGMNAQIKVNVKDKVVTKTDERANQRTDEAIDQGLNKVEEGLKGVFKKKDKKNKEKAETEEVSEEAPVEEAPAEEAEPSDKKVKDSHAKTSVLAWNKYDFVPGDQVIFEDNLQNEENGEFPSRWDLFRGNAEVAILDGEKVIMMRDGAPMIVPYFKDPQKDHLPEVFTVELDLHYASGLPFEIFLWDKKNHQFVESLSGYTHISVQHNEMALGDIRSTYPDEDKDTNRWIHISIAYTNGKLKAYMDDTRLINIPKLDFDPSGITLHAYHASNENVCYVKNIRIAKGGVKYYDRVMQDGRIIVNGIRFDVGKATLKPESMGPINEIFKLMKDNGDLKFSVEGHTDSQGDDAFNMKLSEERARVVMNTLVNMGISADRLTSRGWGESKPISNNASPEDMANNRRVEFVKM